MGTSGFLRVRAMSQGEQELRAMVAYVGPAGAGCVDNLRALAQCVLPEPRVNEGSGPATLSLVLTAPWSGEPLRVQLEAWDEAPASPMEWKRLASADVLVFVADSQNGRMADNAAAFEQLARALEAQGPTLANRPHVIQYNNRERRCVLPVREMRAALNPHGADEVEAAAARGRGALTTLVLALHAISPRRSHLSSAPR